MRTAGRSASLQRRLSRWRGFFYLVGALAVGTIMVLLITQQNPVDVMLSSMEAPVLSLQLILSARNGQFKAREEYQQFGQSLQLLPPGTFILEDDFLSCLASTATAAGGEFCLGILLEKDVLHFGLVVEENWSPSIFDAGKAVSRRFCTLKESVQCYGGPFCKEPNKSMTLVSAVTFVTLAQTHRSRTQQQIFDITLFREHAAQYWISGARTNQTHLECTGSRPLDSGVAFDGLYLAPQPAKVFSKIQLGALRSHDLTVPIVTPVDPSEFLYQLRTSNYVSCANLLSNRTFSLVEEDQEKLFRSRVRSLLRRIARILDEEMRVPWWLASGTCLGWYRQCDVIPYTMDVDIGMWIEDYRPEMIDVLQAKGFDLAYRLGKLNDSFQLSFVYKETKLDIYFFYKENDHVWNGATAYHAGQKFKYTFARFSPCRASLLDIIVRVPCQAEQYITANYGRNWTRPVEDWDWRVSPPNAKLNGFWTPEQRSDGVIYLNPKYYGKESALAETGLPLASDATVRDVSSSSTTPAMDVQTPADH
ncbi:Fukutin [Hypsibius exemplaris]|uniref:Fukutin n=1 Tax=Hypsibius exemplaris TaxID=2072580 RepID=A0A1W0WY28_HYPEX|nr:Fukutin [Hypsibius exemplaris]